jgi:hypothetical protein
VAAHKVAAHRVAAHRVAAHRVAAHGVAAHRVAAHRVAVHRVAAHNVAAHGVAAHTAAAHRVAAHRAQGVSADASGVRRAVPLAARPAGDALLGWRPAAWLLGLALAHALALVLALLAPAAQTPSSTADSPGSEHPVQPACHSVVSAYPPGAPYRQPAQSYYTQSTNGHSQQVLS